MIKLFVILIIATCHGLQLNTGYNYLYKTTTQLNNNDHLGKEPVGFKFQSHVKFCNVWQNENNYILQVKLSKDRMFKTLKDESSSDSSNAKRFDNEEQYPLYAHMYEDENIQRVENFYLHNQDTTTEINLKRAIVRRLRTKPSDLPNVDWIKTGQEIVERFDSTKNEEHFESMLKPDKFNKYEVRIKINRDHSFVSDLNGWQNISFASRLYKEAHSKYHSTFELILKGEEQCKSDFKPSMSLDQALANLESFLRTSGSETSREKQPCHNCKQLKNLISETKDTLSESASLDSSLTFLTIVERIRSSGPGAGKQEILEALNKVAKDEKVTYNSSNSDQPSEMLSALLDHCAAARTEPALEAALEHLDLPSNNNLDIAERFLVTSSVSCMTLATTNAANSAYEDSSNVNSAYVDHTNVDTSHVYFVEKLLQLLNHQWSSNKLKWATQLAIGNLVKCHNILLSNEVRSKYTDLNSLSNTLDQFALDENLLKKGDLRMHIKGSEEKNLVNVFSDELNVKVIDYLVSEYEKCADADCREVLLVSLGNTGNLVLVCDALENVASQSKLRKEQVAALKALKECLEFNFRHNPVNHIINTGEDSPLIEKLNYNDSGLHVIVYNKIKRLLASVVYNSQSETTARILASELIAKYFSDDVQLINSLIRDMLHFNNFELTTLMWIKMKHVWTHQQNQLIRQRRSTEETATDAEELKTVKGCPGCKNQLKHLNHWVHATNVLNGSSTLFNRPLGCSSTMNATYGISMELLSAGKLLKETNFDIGLEGLRAAEQSLFGVSIFARGLSSFSGGDDNEASNEETQAGMSLRVLNVQLRPYTFFKGKSELMSHVWSGTGSEPTPIFRGNFLIADHNQAISLLNGFVLEEKMYGVLSLNVLGQVSVSLWNRNSHSVVTANSALLIRGSHSVTSSQIGEAYVEQRFAFGGSGRIEFVTDTDFYNTPFKMCLQITQPKFNIRHNTRKYEQVNSGRITRRIHRRNYEIPAKSYPLHKDNNIMCAAMNIED